MRTMVSYIAQLSLFFLIIFLKHTRILSILKPDVIVTLLFIMALYGALKLHLMTILLLGVLDDILSNHLLGASSLVWLITVMIVYANRKVLSQSHFILTWLIFCIIEVISFSILTYFNMAHNQTPLNVSALFVTLITILAYPIFQYVGDMILNKEDAQ